MRNRALLLVVLLPFLVACPKGCDDRSPVSPTGGSTPPVLPVLTVVAARTGQPVVGAAVVYQGNRATVSAPAGFVSPSVVNVVGSVTHGLWPDDAALPYSWIESAVYSTYTGRRLRRPHEGVLPVGLSEDGSVDAFAGPAYAWALEALNRAQSRVRFEAGGAQSPVRIYADPRDSAWSQPGYENAWAVAYADVRGDVIVGGRIVFRFWTDPGNGGTQTRLRFAIAHELGHLYGFGHPEGGIMGSGTATDFSDREREMMELMFLRPPGTRPPDDAGDVTASVASAGVRHVLVCVID